MKIKGGSKLIGGSYHRAKPTRTLHMFDNKDPNIPINGVYHLDPALTINSQTVYPTLRYTAGGGLVDASDWRPWGYGENLDIAGAGAVPTMNTGSPLLGLLDDSVRGEGGKRYDANNGTFADITTEDVVFELILEYSSTGNTRLVSKLPAGAATGWQFTSEGSKEAFYAYSGGNFGLVNSDTLILGVIYHLIYFLDRSGSGICYTNASAGTAASLSTGGNDVQASWTTATVFSIFDAPNYSIPYDKRLMYFSMWKKANWLDTHLQPTIAQERFRKVTGAWPKQARGTANPTVVTRASLAHLDKIDAQAGYRKLYQVGSGWFRLSSRLDTNGKLLKGYLGETQATNRSLQSQTFNSWTNYLSTCPATATECPNEETLTTVTISEDGSNTTHGVYIQQTSPYVNGSTYCYSAWMKAVNRDFGALRIQRDSAGVSECIVIFDLTDGSVNVGGVTNASAYGAEYWGNGWWRVWATFVAQDDAGNPYNYIALASDATTLTFQGLTQESIRVFGEQLELGTYPSSYIITTAAEVIRQADVLQLVGNDGNLPDSGDAEEGEIRANILLPDFTPNADMTLINIDDASDPINDHIVIRVDSGTDAMEVETRATGGDPGDILGSTDPSDNVVHAVRFKFRFDDLTLYLDGGSEGTDTDANIPNALDEIDIGNDSGSITQFNSLIADLEIFAKKVRN